MSDLNPWEVEGVSWKSESQYWNWVRGVLRKGWSRHPVKLEFVKQNKKQIKPNVNPNGRNDWCWGMTCACCGNDFPLPINATRERKKKILENYKREHGEYPVFIEVNHKTEAGSLQNKEDVARFSSNLLYVNFEDLEPVCQNCHAIISYSQKEGVTFEEAGIIKQAIEIQKNKQDKDWLEANNLVPASNAKQRRQQIIDKLMEEINNA